MLSWVRGAITTVVHNNNRTAWRRGLAKLRWAVARLWRRARRPLILLVLFGLTGLFFVALVLALARLYFPDTRLRRLAQSWLEQRLQTHVDIGRLEFSLWRGVTLEEVSVGSMTGFSHESGALQRLALHWRAGDLLRGRLTLREVSIAGLRLVSEDNSRGNNLEALVARLAGRDPAAARLVPADDAAFFDWSRPPQQPFVPLRIEVQSLRLSVAEAWLVRPEVRARLDRVELRGRLRAQGRQLAVELWAGLGDWEAGETSASALAVERLVAGQMALRLEAQQRLKITLASSGFHDVRLGLTADIAATLREGGKLLPMQVRAEGELSADLSAGRADLKNLRVQVGEETSLKLQAQLREAFTQPQLELQQGSACVQLAELAPWVRLAVPRAQMRGTVTLEVAPGVVALKELPQGGDGALAAVAQLKGVQGELAPWQVRGAEATLRAGVAERRASIEAAVAVADLHLGPQQGRGLQAEVRVVSEVAPWLTDAAASTPLRAHLNAAVAHMRAAPGTALERVALELEASAPVGWLKRQAGASAANAKLAASVGAVTAPTFFGRGAQLVVQAALQDLVAERAAVQANLQVAHWGLGRDQAQLRLPALLATLDAEKRAAAIEVRRVGLDVGDGLHVALQGGVDYATPEALELRQVSLKSEPFDLAQLAAWVPEALWPQGKAAAVAGQLGVAVRADGRLAYQALLQQAALPQVTWDSADAAKRAAFLQAYSVWLRAWADRLGAGMGLHLGATVALKQASYRGGKEGLGAEGLEASAAVTLADRALQLEAQVAAASLAGPVRGERVKAAGGVTFSGQESALAVDLSAATLAWEAGRRPFTELAVAGRVRQLWGGDFRLEQLKLAEASTGARLSVDGVVSKPERILAQQSWQEVGLAGLAASLHFAAALSRKEAAASTSDSLPGAAVWRGAASLAGRVEIGAGEATLRGTLNLDQFSWQGAALVVEEATGELPFDVRLAFEPRANWAVFDHVLGFGGGTVAVATVQQEDQGRPARPRYYTRLRPYRGCSGLQIRRLQIGGHELDNLAMEARLEHGMLAVDGLSLHVLGGDVAGDLAVQLGSDRSVRLDAQVKLSHIDASYFKALQLEPGVESQLHADARLGLHLAPRRRDLTLNMNITKIGTKTLDRFLQLLDPDAANARIQQQRRQMWWFRTGAVRLDEVALWIRYENLYMDLAATSFMRVPFTQISYVPVEREMVRRVGISGFLDAYLQPAVESYLAKPLRWAAAR